MVFVNRDLIGEESNPEMLDLFLVNKKASFSVSDLLYRQSVRRMEDFVHMFLH